MSAEVVPLTVVVVSCNDEGLLDRCLGAFAGWAHEIVLLDMHSEDESVEVGRRHGARVVPVPRRPIAEQVRQFGLDACRTDWMLYVDPDEVLPDGMEKACRSAIAEWPQAAAFRWPFVDMFFDQPLTHSRAGSRKIVLLNRNRVVYNDQHRAHEEPACSGPIVDLPAAQAPAVQHFTYRSVPAVAEKLARYAATGNPMRGHAIHGHSLMLPRLWLREVIGTRAWKDGKAGIDAASLAALHDYVASLRQWEIEGAPSRPLRRRAVWALAAVAAIGDLNRWRRTVLSAGAAQGAREGSGQ